MRPKLSDTTLLEELRLYPDDFQNYLGMDYDIYNELLELISPLIVKQDTNFRDAITPHERLAATSLYIEDHFHSFTFYVQTRVIM